MIPLNKPGRLTSPNTSQHFLADLFPLRNAYVVSTASDALNIIYKKLYEERGALRVGVSPLVCFQAIYPIISNGHIPVYLDVDPDSFNLDPRKLAGRDDIQALEVIHLGGNPNEMDLILKYAQERGIPVIEDCAQAMGSSFDGRRLGNFGDYAAFSFIKNLHVPSGGFLLSKTDMSECLEKVPVLDKRIELYRKIKVWLESKADQRSYNVWNWLYGGLMSLKGDTPSISKVCHQLKERDVREIETRLGGFDALLSQRLSNAELLINRIDTSHAMIQHVPDKGVSNRNRLMLRLIYRDADKVITALRNKGIAANNLTQNYKCGFQSHISQDFTLGKYYIRQELESYNQVFPRIIAIPSSPFLTTKEINHITYHLNALIS